MDKVLRTCTLQSDVLYFKEGDKMSNPALADTLQKIAENGAEVFYNGPIADSIVAAVSYEDTLFIFLHF